MRAAAAIGSGHNGGVQVESDCALRGLEYEGGRLDDRLPRRTAAAAAAAESEVSSGGEGTQVVG